MATRDDAPGTEDLEAGMQPSPLRVVPKIFVAALVPLLFFNSLGIANWTRSLPPTEFHAGLNKAAVAWHDIMLSTGPARVFAWLRDTIGVKLD